MQGECVGDMNCKETEKSIPSFLKGELEGDRLAEFVEHIEQCPECKEELSIQFLVTEGMEKLEEGSSFNLQKALHDRMEESRRYIRMNRLLRRTLYWLEALVIVVIAVAFCIYFEWI
jgi:predicted anti-sigma-YlaC factor YlaD